MTWGHLIWFGFKMIAANELLGVGIYSPREAAQYARVQTRLMTRWLYGTKDGLPVIETQFGEDEKVVTFLDFIQALAIRRIRDERKIPLETIREGFVRARNEFGVPYPFALDSTQIGLFGPPDEPKKQQIWLCVNKNNEDAERYFQITGKQHGNQLFAKIVLTYSYKLLFDEITKLARKYIPLEAKGERVIMDPTVQFGEPFIESSGYKARTLYDAYISEGTIERAANIYGVDIKQVEIAIEYFDYLALPSTAA